MTDYTSDDIKNICTFKTSLSPEIIDKVVQVAQLLNNAVNKGTIHILRKHFYSTKLNLTCKFFSKNVFFLSKQKNSFVNITFLQIFHKNCFFFVKTKEFLFRHYILTKFSCWSLKLLLHKEKCSKNSWKCCGW